MILTFCAYSTALRAPFQFDDLSGIRSNQTIRQLVPIAVPLTPPANTPVAGRPVVNLSLAVNYALNDAMGVDQRGASGTAGYHLFNVLVHLGCGLLLFAVVRRTAAAYDGPAHATTLAGMSPKLVRGFVSLANTPGLARLRSPLWAPLWSATGALSRMWAWLRNRDPSCFP